jgi:hypothetical protein
LVGKRLFRFDVELTPERNPPGLYDKLHEELRSWIVARGLDYGMGAIGGGKHLYGQVGPNPPATDGDRAAMADWLRGQRMHATVRLGSVVTFSEDLDMLAPITDLVFAVDTLTEAERVHAVAFYTQLRRRVEDLRRKHPEPLKHPSELE